MDKGKREDQSLRNQSKSRASKVSRKSREEVNQAKDEVEGSRKTKLARGEARQLPACGSGRQLSSERRKRISENKETDPSVSPIFFPSFHFFSIFLLFSIS